MIAFIAIAAGAVLISAPSAAGAQSAPSGARVIRVPCSSVALAGAITTANATPAILRLAANCTYNLTAALPQITGNVALMGGPSTVIRRDTATPNIRILDVAATGTLHIAGIFILNGLLGGGNGAGIQNAGTLVMRYSTVSGNQTSTGNGGGIANTGRALIANSVIATNVTFTGNGGGIHNDGDLTVVASRLAGNVVNNLGAGLYTAAGRTTRVIQSTISANLGAAGSGAGVASAGTTRLVRTAVELNRSPTGGGVSVLVGGVVTLDRSIVRRNSTGNCLPLNSVPGCVG
jgi:hypothetical protein